jgi:hypothetical protein
VTYRVWSNTTSLEITRVSQQSNLATIKLSAACNFSQPNNSNHQDKTQHKPHIMSADALFGQGIFEDLQRKIDEDTAVKDVCGDQRLQNPMA